MSIENRLKKQVTKFNGIKLWNIDKNTWYCLVPYAKRGIMGNKYVISTYMKDGRFKYLQYEISKREAERLMTFGTLNPKKARKKAKAAEKSYTPRGYNRRKAVV